jgi:hypothetical protein
VFSSHWGYSDSVGGSTDPRHLSPASASHDQGRTGEGQDDLFLCLYLYLYLRLACLRLAFDHSPKPGKNPTNDSKKGSLSPTSGNVPYRL